MGEADKKGDATLESHRSKTQKEDTGGYNGWSADEGIDTAFRQQRLKAWQPILTPKTVLPLFFAIGIIFAPIGGALLYASAQVCLSSSLSPSFPS